MVYESPFPKVRLGRDKDGGYVICQTPEGYDILVSAGIGRDCSFEDAWMLMNPGVPCHAWDGTISRCPSKNVTWIRKNVGFASPETHDDLSSSIKGKTFLKMDIEGAEVDWILRTDRLDDVLQMVVEFHNQPFSPKHELVYKKMNMTHVLVHLHGNNYSGTVVHNGVEFPVTFECTYLHRSLVQNPTPNRSPLPCPQDMPNNPGGKDIDLNHPPFVNAGGET